MGPFDWLRRLFSTPEVPSPGQIIPEAEVVLEDNICTIDLNRLNIPFVKDALGKALVKSYLETVADTNSMDPTLDIGMLMLEVGGANAENHHILCEHLTTGDIIIFRIYGGKRIVHRIAAITIENGRRRFWTKGDNNAFQDPFAVYGDDIEWLVAAIIHADRK